MVACSAIQIKCYLLKEIIPTAQHAEIRTAQAATEQFFSILIPKASYMSVNCPEATRKLQTTGWS